MTANKKKIEIPNTQIGRPTESVMKKITEFGLDQEGEVLAVDAVLAHCRPGHYLSLTALHGFTVIIEGKPFHLVFPKDSARLATIEADHEWGKKMSATTDPKSGN